MKGKDAERGDDLKVESWAYSEELYDCHLIFRWGAIRMDERQPAHVMCGRFFSIRKYVLRIRVPK